MSAYNNNLFLLIVLIVVILLLFLIVSLVIARYGRKYHLPEEVTKGIKSDTPFPSITSSHNSRHHHHSRQNISKNSSTFDLLNNEPYIPTDFVINDSTFIVRKEFVPQSVDELPIKKNQILSVKEIYEDGWCMAISVNTGEMGVVPFQCLYKYTDLLKRKRSYQKQKHMQQPKIPSVSSIPPVPSIPSMPTMPSSSYCKSYTTSPIVFNSSDYI